MFTIKDKVGHIISECDSYYDATQKLETIEQEDLKDGVFSEGFYEIVPSEPIKPISTCTVNAYEVNDEFLIEVESTDYDGEKYFDAVLIKQNYALRTHIMSCAARQNGRELTEELFVAMIMNQVHLEIDTLNMNIELCENAWFN